MAEQPLAAAHPTTPAAVAVYLAALADHGRKPLTINKAITSKWATILAAVATRIERMKYLSRTQPDLPASVELEPIEIEALKIERRDRKKRQKPVLPEMPTLAEATRWIAEMGGWMGEKSSGPPGSITLARGLDRLAIYTHALAVVRAEGGKRSRR